MRLTRFTQAVLATVVALTFGGPGAAAPTGWAADGPDLKLEQVRLFVNANGQVNDRVVSFKVTNVGNRAAPTVMGKLEILSPAPAREEPLQLQELKPGASFDGFAQLGAPCNGHIVRVTVSAPGETSFGDNTFGPVKLCPDKPKPNVTPGDGILVSEPNIPPLNDVLLGPDNEIDLAEPNIPPLAEVLLGPRRLRPGAHKDSGEFPAEVLEPSVFHVHELERTNSGILGCLPDGEGLMIVGSSHVGYYFMDRLGCDRNWVYQLVLNFDLAWLRGIDKKSISTAELLFDENPFAKNDDGEPVNAETCIGRLGLAPSNWREIVARRGGRGSLIPTLLTSEPIQGDRLAGGPGVTSRWDVMRDVRWASSSHNEPLVGLVLHGLDENLNAETERACGSTLRNVRLKLEYTVQP